MLRVRFGGFSVLKITKGLKANWVDKISHFGQGFPLTLFSEHNSPNFLKIHQIWCYGVKSSHLYVIVTKFIVSPCVAMYCLPSFFSVNGFYGFYGGILHGRAPIVSTARQIPAMSCHPLIFSQIHNFSF